MACKPTARDTGASCELLCVVNRLVDAGNTMVVIEHNRDVIKTADWIRKRRGRLGVLYTTALVAAYVPACRAAAVDAARTLRAE